MNTKARVLIFSQHKAYPVNTRGAFKKNVVPHDYLGKDVDVDAARLYDFFMSNFEIEPTVRNNNTKSVILETIKDERSQSADSEMLILFFLTFLSECEGSSNEGLFDCLDSTIDLEEIIEEVKKLKTYHGKPKLILIQADDVNLTDRRREMLYKGTEPSLERRPAIKIPTDSDRLVIISRLPQELALHQKLSDVMTGMTLASCSKQSSESRSLFIEAFCNVLTSDRFQNEDFLTQTAVINGQVNKVIQQLKQKDENDKGVDLPLPLVSSTLTMPVHFSKLRCNDAVLLQ